MYEKGSLDAWFIVKISICTIILLYMFYDLWAINPWSYDYVDFGIPNLLLLAKVFFILDSIFYIFVLKLMIDWIYK